MTTHVHHDIDRDTSQVVERDPVCGAPILDEASAPSLEYGGERHWFCGDDCREIFAAEPERFAVDQDLEEVILDQDLTDEVIAQSSDGEAGVLRDEPRYIDR